MGESGTGAALVPPRYANGGVEARCPSCGAQMQQDASHDGDMVCAECGYVAGRGQRFFVDFDFKSVSEEGKTGTLVIEGYGNTWDEDRDGETTAKGAFDRSLAEFMTNPVLLLNHQKDQVLGNVTDARPDTKGLWIRAEVDRPPQGAPGWAVKAYADVKSGRLRAFSMGGLFYRDGDGKTIRRVDLYEMSVVTIPSNKTSLFRLTGEKAADWDFDPQDYISGKAYSAEQRRQMAESGEAMSDGTFPIRNGTDLRKAIRLWGHADDPAAAKAHIIKRAKALNLVSMLPDDWDVSKSASSSQKGVNGMADENGTGAAGTKGAGDGADTVTVSKKDWERTQDVLNALAGEKAERDRQAEVERRAKEALDAEAKQKEAEAKAAAEREAEIKAAVDSRIKELRTGMSASATGGRKMVYGGGSGAPGGKAAEGNLATMMKHLVNAKRGNHDSFKWLEDQHQKAADFYGETLGEKAYGEGTNSAGGYLVPPLYLQSGLAEFRIAQAKARGLCTVIPGVGTNAVLIPRETGISSVGWTAENASKPSTDATYGQISVNIFTLAGIAKVSKQLLNDSTPAVDAIVRRGLGKALGQAEDLAVINGSGTGQPTGILNTSGVLTGAVGTKLWSSIAGSIATIQSNYFANPTAILAHPRDVNTLRTTSDSSGRPIFLPNYWQGGGPAAGGAVSYLAGGAVAEQEAAFRMAQPDGYVFGLPVYSDANIPTNLGAGANETRMIIAAWDEAWVFEREGVTMDVSGEAGTSFEQNQFWFRAELREGFTAARQPSAFYVMTGLTAGAGL